MITLLMSSLCWSTGEEEAVVQETLSLPSPLEWDCLPQSPNVPQKAEVSLADQKVWSVSECACQLDCETGAVATPPSFCTRLDQSHPAQSGTTRPRPLLWRSLATAITTQFGTLLNNVTQSQEN